MSDHRTIETPRLILRPPVLADFDGFAAFQADAETMRFLGGVQPRSLAWRGFMTMAGAWSLQGYAMFCVIEKASGRWIGRLGPWMPEGWPGTEVGWGIAREFAGRGYATEGASAAIDWAFEHLGWTQVIHTIDPLNVGSRVVAQKLGSRLLGPTRLPAPYEHENVEAWGQSREEWFARRR
ncbi:GNAT family N-acetyltransferase [Tahibacter soli]|uniref:GNAT family N-acetyltransferase n=1 Tax=Tahibacter soli TaxID=2983605 RepID=A0A9X3YGP4_9GAMM|nr:GNAT family N-acetyltransferase [Tahibacter soli]MDC8011949.1 GNAT family N-acetyltransferase [Tahibacter soli]